MEPIFHTTIGAIRNSVEQTIVSLIKEHVAVKANLLSKVKACNSLDEVYECLKPDHSNTLESRIAQYEEDLEYLNACDGLVPVMLSKSEWRHYCKGSVKPEMC